MFGRGKAGTTILVTIRIMFLSVVAFKIALEQFSCET